MLKTALNLKPLAKWFSDGSLTKKASLNALASALDYGARLVVGLAINPLLLAGLGDYLYGIWQILGRLIGYISAASGRPTQALKFTIAHKQSSIDYAEKRRNVGSAVIVGLLFVPLLAALGGVLTWFAPTWLSVPSELALSVRLAAGLLVADLIMTSLADIPRSVLQGENLGYKRMGLSTILVFAGGGLTALAMYLGAGLPGAAAADLAATMLTGALFLLVVRMYAPWFGIARPSWLEIRRFFGLSWWFFVWRLVMQLMIASDVVVLGLLISVEHVTDYTLTKYIPETLISLVAIVVFGIAPGLGGIIGAGNMRKAARVRGEIAIGTWLIATVVGTTTLLWNRSFLQLWVGEGYYAGVIPTLLIMIMVTQFVLIRNDANIIDLTLDVRRKTLIGLASAVVSLLFAVALVDTFDLGVVGLCLGFIAGRAILSLGYPWLVGRSLGIPLAGQLLGALRPACVTALLFLLVLGVGDRLAAGTWASLTLAVGATVLAVSPVAFYAGLSGEQRRQIAQRVVRVLRPGAEE